MRIYELQTPAILLDLDILERNINKYHSAAKEYGKELWPMAKTTKSRELMKMQAAAGSTGFLGGTLDECEAAYDIGARNIMYAYPVASPSSVARAVALAGKCNYINRLDSFEVAEILDKAAAEAGVKIGYSIIIDCGLHRFGIAPEKAAEFGEGMKKYRNLVFKGISTHPGHIYSVQGREAMAECIEGEQAALKKAKELLTAIGMIPQIVSSGSTPTFWTSLHSEWQNIIHPGVYPFNDCMQIAAFNATEDDCALTVYATIISHPTENTFICDAGTKCFGLDTGGHGFSSVKGFGLILEHPEAEMYALSEEVGKIKVDGPTDLKIGDCIRVIPNHACSTANATNYFIGVRGNEVERVIEVDLRANSTRKNVK